MKGDWKQYEAFIQTLAALSRRPPGWTFQGLRIGFGVSLDASGELTGRVSLDGTLYEHDAPQDAPQEATKPPPAQPDGAGEKPRFHLPPMAITGCLFCPMAAREVGDDAPAMCSVNGAVISYPPPDDHPPSCPLLKSEIAVSFEARAYRRPDPPPPAPPDASPTPSNRPHIRLVDEDDLADEADFADE